MLKKINAKQILLIGKIAVTVASLFLFLVWLMFMTNNFYPKTTTSVVAKIMKAPLQVMIWPVTIIILFIFIMPIWVTNNKVLLMVFLLLAVTMTILSGFFVIALNINNFWFIWLVAHILAITALLFVIFINSDVFFVRKKIILEEKK